MKPYLVATFLLCLTALIACSDDPVPAYVEPDAVALDAPPLADQVESEPESVAEPAVQQAREDPERESHQVIPFRATGELVGYRMPGDFWQPKRAFSNGALLFANGWSLLPRGEVWVRLAIQSGGHQGLWVEHDESWLPISEVLTLPEVEAPESPDRDSERPTAEIALPSGEHIAVSLLGKSANGRSFAARLHVEELVLWVEQSDLEVVGSFGQLPDYEGVIAGDYRPRTITKSDQLVYLTNEAYRSESNIFAWPGGPKLPFRLPQWGLPVLGRSLDGNWIALRLTEIDPPIVWVPTEDLQRVWNVSFEDLPVALSAGLEVFTLNSSGQATHSVFAPIRPAYWEWRSDDELLLHDQNGASWLWDVTTDEQRLLTTRTIANVSPDGKFAIELTCPDESQEPSWDLLRYVALVSMENGEVLGIGSERRLSQDHPTQEPSHSQASPTRRGCERVLWQGWSPDSKWVMTRWNLASEPENERFLAISIGGELIEIILPERPVFFNWNDLEDFRQAGEEIVYLTENGDAIDRPWSEADFEVAGGDWPDLPSPPPGWYTTEAGTGRFGVGFRGMFTEHVDERGVSAYPGGSGRGWGISEIGILTSSSEVGLILRRYGAECGRTTSYLSWSPTRNRIAFGPKWRPCW